MASCLRAKPSNAFCLCRFYSSSRAYGRIWEDGNNQKWYQSSKRLTFLASGFGLVGGTALWLAYRKQERNDSGLVPFVQAASPSTYDMKRVNRSSSISHVQFFVCHSPSIFISLHIV